eukprot:COSAG04_NODE_2749_length_3644_cov_4.300705_5_plen_116_part_00
MHSLLPALTNTRPDFARFCVGVLPGSHRARCPLHDELPAEDPNLHGGRDWKTEEPWEEDGSASPFFSDPEGAVDVPIRPGELVIGDSRLLHATWREYGLSLLSLSASSQLPLSSL